MPLSLFLSLFLSFSAASAIQLSLFLPCSFFPYRTDGCVSTHACKRRQQARVVRAMHKRNPYTRARAPSLSRSTTINLSERETALSLQRARKSLKGKSRCERVRPILAHSAAVHDACYAHARGGLLETINALSVNCARQTRQKSKSLPRCRPVANATRPPTRGQHLPRCPDNATHFPHTHRTRIVRVARGAGVVNTAR